MHFWLLILCGIFLTGNFRQSNAADALQRREIHIENFLFKEGSCAEKEKHLFCLVRIHLPERTAQKRQELLRKQKKKIPLSYKEEIFMKSYRYDFVFQLKLMQEDPSVQIDHIRDVIDSAGKVYYIGELTWRNAMPLGNCIKPENRGLMKFMDSHDNNPIEKHIRLIVSYSKKEDYDACRNKNNIGTITIGAQ